MRLCRPYNDGATGFTEEDGLTCRSSAAPRRDWPAATRANTCLRRGAPSKPGIKHLAPKAFLGGSQVMVVMDTTL